MAVMWFSELREDLWQLRFPQAFRIGRSEWPTATLAEAEEFLRQQGDPPPNPRSPGTEGDDREFWCALATVAWRLRKRTLDPATGEARPEHKRLARPVAAVVDLLAERGIEIQDHDGQAYDTGLSLSVLTFEPTDGLTDERVKETIKPTVYLRKMRIQQGEVVVGTPRD